MSDAGEMKRIINLIAEEDQRQDIRIADGRPIFVEDDSATQADQVTDTSPATLTQSLSPSGSNASTIVNDEEGSGHQPASAVANAAGANTSAQAIGTLAQQIHNSRRTLPSIQRKSRGAFPAHVREEPEPESLMAVIEDPLTYARPPAPSLPNNLQASPTSRTAPNGLSRVEQRALILSGRNPRPPNPNATSQNSSAPRANPPGPSSGNQQRPPSQPLARLARIDLDDSLRADNVVYYILLDLSRPGQPVPPGATMLTLFARTPLVSIAHLRELAGSGGTLEGRRAGIELEMVDGQRHTLTGFGAGDVARATIVQALVEDMENVDSDGAGAGLTPGRS